MNLLEKLSSLIRPSHHTRRQPMPPVEIDVGPSVPAWALRGAVFLLTLVAGLIVVTGPGQWVLFVTVAILIVTIEEGAIGVLAAFLVAGFHLMGPGVPPGWQTGAVIATVHLILVFTLLFNELPASTRVQLQVLRRPLASWAAVQVGVQAVAMFAWLLKTSSEPGPWIAMAAGLALCGAVLGVLAWFRKNTT